MALTDGNEGGDSDDPAGLTRPPTEFIMHIRPAPSAVK